MKKFLSKIMFAAVAVLSVAGFTSCNNADDPYVPETAPEQPKYTEVASYGVVLSENLLDMYDVTIIIRNGDKTKEIVPTKDNALAKENNCYKFAFPSIDKVEAKVTPKANIKTIIENLPEKEVSMTYGSGPMKAIYDANDKYMGEIQSRMLTHTVYYLPSKMLVEEDGTINYDYYAGAIEASISQNY